jgi:2-polyprenyl-6-methoxyphenol hydroxylase-like FAD-dependent oxidoreductase
MVATADVLVVGAGPTGLLLGAELCRRGVACRIIDEHPAPGRGIARRSCTHARSKFSSLWE